MNRYTTEDNKWAVVWIDTPITLTSVESLPMATAYRDWFQHTRYALAISMKQKITNKTIENQITT